MDACTCMHATPSNIGKDLAQKNLHRIYIIIGGQFNSKRKLE